MARKLKDALKSCMWKTARYVVRFFADLVNCHVISTNSLLQLYHSFLDTAREDNAPQGMFILYIYFKIILDSAISWIAFLSIFILLYFYHILIINVTPMFNKF